MLAASGPSFLASLRAYFSQRHTRVRTPRAVRARARRPHHSASRFTLELLEERLLLSAAPVVGTDAAIGDAAVLSAQQPALVGEPAGTVPQAAVSLELPGAGSALTASPSASAQRDAAYGQLPLSFEQNQGQTDPSVQFLANGQGYSLFLTPTEAVLSLSQPSTISSELSAVSESSTLSPQSSVLRLSLEGANPDAGITGLDPLEGRVNYFVGSDPANWHTEIPTFGKVLYSDAYQGIDLLFYGNQQQLEYDWVVAPGADPGQIQMRITGAEHAMLDADGNLILSLVGGDVSIKTPVAYQLIGGERVSVDSKYRLTEGIDGDSHYIDVSLNIGSYDQAYQLIIDPTLAYSTYLGGSSGEGGTSLFGSGIAVDAAGNAYVTGSTSSTGFPGTSGSPIQSTYAGGVNDAFVTKINAAGTAILYSTYLGGSGDDSGSGIAVDAAGNAYVMGTTSSTGFPGTATSPIQNTLGGQDAFITKLNATGTAILYSTYLGGSSGDYGFGIAVDAAGAAYVTGWTFSTGFPGTSGSPIQSTYAGGGFTDAFVTKINATGTALLYSTYLGGSGADNVYGIAVDAAGAAYVTGSTLSTGFPGTATSPIQNTFNGSGSQEAFVTKVNAAGTALVYSTYLGGSAQDNGSSIAGIAVDAAGAAYVTGKTVSTDFPGTATSPIQSANAGASDAFVTKVNAAGTALVYSTYLGGSGSDAGSGIAVDAAGAAYVTGFTGSTGFPGTATSPIQNTFGGGASDAFVAKLTTQTAPTVPVTPPPGLLGWWTGNGNASDAAGSHNGSLVNGVSFAPGPVGQAFSFDGVDDYVDVGSAIQLGGDMTVSAWIKTGSDPNIQFIAGSRATTGSQSGWEFLVLPDGKLQFQVAAVGGGTRTGLSNVRDNQWHHVLGVREGANFYVYVDGVREDGSGTVGSGDGTSGTSTFIGKTTSLNDSAGRRFAGTIDEFEIYNRALSASEIQAVFNAGSAGQSRLLTTAKDTARPVTLIGSDRDSDPLGFTVLSGPQHGTLSAVTPLPLSGLVSQWAAEGNAVDSAGSNNGTLANGATFSSSGKVGQAFAFDGVDDVVTTPLTMSYGLGATFSAWIRTTSDRGVIIAGGGGASGERGMGLFVNPVGGGVGQLLFTGAKGTSGVGNFNILGPTVNDGQFHHVVGTWTGDTTSNGVKLYLDGQLVSATTALATIGTDTRPLNIGAHTAEAYDKFTGAIDEVEIYNRALSTTEIQALYAAGNTTQVRVGSGVDGGSVVYTPTPGFVGRDSFTFKASDGFVNSNISTVLLNVGTVFTVNDVGDAVDANPGDGVALTAGGVTTLRAAIQEANALSGLNAIQFNIAGAGVHTITPLSGLPAITDPVVIDGTTQPGFAGTPIIELNGTSAGALASGLVMSATNSTVRSLVINRFTSDGIIINGAGNTVVGNFIGTDVTGTAALGNGGSGVSVLTGAANNTIGGTTVGARNVISGNTDGVRIVGLGVALPTTIQGNYIGTDVTGTLDVGNTQSGVRIESTANVTVRDNVISGNNQSGVQVVSGPAGISTNSILGNLIGTNAAGTAALGNTLDGITINDYSFQIIGGTTAADRNIIAGNGGNGITLMRTSGTATNNTIQGNFIGTNAAGTGAIANGQIGVVLSNSAAGNTIGGTTAGARNIISGNTSDGVEISSSNNTLVQGNYIGTNATGTGAIANGQQGVLILQSSGNTIGGTTAGARNIISGNTNAGIRFQQGSNNNLVQGNYIGTDVTGTAPIPNAQGVSLFVAASGNQIGGANATPGGAVSGAGNLISGNVIGVHFTSSTTAGTSNNIIQGNYIGTDVTGTVAIPSPAGTQADYGLFLSGSGVTGNVIGGLTPATRNVISGNSSQTGFGVVISAGPTGNTVQGNFIGTNAAGTSALPNKNIGVEIQDAADNTIGGTSAGAGNVISGNGSGGQDGGVRLYGAAATGNIVAGNLIGTDATGTVAIPNATGVVLENSATGNTIGGTTAGAANTIAFNTSVGVWAVAAPTVAGTGNAILTNAIFSNGGLGIDLGVDAAHNTGVTPNDLGDADTGPNNLQNFPVLTSVYPGSAVITGTLNSTANTEFTLEFFSNPAGTGDPSGFGEGRTFLGRTAVTTTAGGNAAFSLTLSTPVAVGEIITATATDPLGNTSEFSAGVVVTNGGVSSAVLNVTTNGTGTGTVTSLPLGINTGASDRTETYPLDTVVTLTATPTGSSIFGGWSGSGVSSASPTLTLTMDQARTVTATFNPAGSTAPPPPVVNFVQGDSLWSHTLTITWTPPAIQPQSYLVYLGTQPGLYDLPIHVAGTQTSLTLTNLPAVPHYFTVSAVYATGTLPLSTDPTTVLSPQTAGLLEPAAAPVAQPDTYYVPVGASFQTVASTGVLANDTDADGQVLTAQLVTAPPASAGTLLLKADGSFIFTPAATFTGPSTTFQYSVSDGTTTVGPITATITIAQASGLSQQSTTTPLSGLVGWTVLDQGTVSGPSLWSGLDPTYAQWAGIDTPGTGLPDLGTQLVSTDGLAQGRTDYQLTLNLASSTSGALGVTFRYVDANNYYRFSMERDPNGDGNTSDGYRRLIKMVNGVATVLMEQSATNPGLPAGSWQPLTGPAYVSGTTYPVTLQAVGSTLRVQLRDPATGTNVVDWTVTDPTFSSSGLALYSAGNPGSSYTLLAVESLENPTQLPLEVRTSGTGVGTVTGQVGTNPISLSLPGAPVASYAPNTVVTLTASEGLNSHFAGWSGASFVTPNPNQPNIIQVTMSAATLLTAQFTGTPVPAYSLDVNADGVATPQDAIVILRYLSLVTGPALTAGVVTGGQRTDPAVIKSYLDGARTTMLDVNQDGAATPQDAIVILRDLSLVSGPALTAGVITGGAQTDPTVIKQYLNRYTPGASISSQDTAFSAPTSSGAGSSAPLAASTVSSDSALTPQDAALTSAVAATQLASASVQSAPWVNQFVGDGATDEEHDVVVML